MKIILVLFSFLFVNFSTYADGHSGKIHLEGFGAWSVNVINAGNGNLSVTYDGLFSGVAMNGTKFGNNSSVQCVGGLTTSKGKFNDETGICKYLFSNGDTAFTKYTGSGEVGKSGYMTWKQIKEIQSSDLATIGNHSHSHEYLIDWEEEKIRDDLEKSIKIFKKELGYSPKLFSYPFGEYSIVLKKIVNDLNFEFAFGQHSGVIDSSKDFLELPRFPINEKYGELKRFKSIINTLPFPYEKIKPENRYIKENENPPKVEINFFKNLIDIKNINCYSNEGNIWRKSDIKFINEFEIMILLKEKFKSERGRINCSLWEEGGKWRWLGVQYVIAEY